MHFYFNFRMLRMQEMGLIGEWLDRYQRKPKQCFNRDKERRLEEIRNPRGLTLKNMVGPFAMMGICFGISFLVFFVEIIGTLFSVAKLRALIF